MKLSETMDFIKLKLDFLYEPLFAFLQIIIIIIIAGIVKKVGNYIIEKFFEKQKNFKYSLDEKRLATMRSLTKSILKYIIYFIAGVAILTKITTVFNLGSVMTAAGIGGLAIGFGAQSLIKDVISGFFILMENQFVVGDLITIDNMTGTVEDIELRVTRIRNFNGDLYVVPNGEIKKITNHVRGNKAVIVDIPVAYSADINQVMDIAQKVCEQVSGEFETIVDNPSVVGITEMGKESMNIRITAKSIANEQWAVERRIRVLIKQAFDKENILFFDRNRIIQK